MMDIGKTFGPEGWGSMEYLVLKGKDPDISELAFALRGGQPVPSEIRTYLADLLEGKRKRKRGRKQVDPSKRAAMRFRQQLLAERVFAGSVS